MSIQKTINELISTSRDLKDSYKRNMKLLTNV